MLLCVYKPSLNLGSDSLPFGDQFSKQLCDTAQRVVFHYYFIMFRRMFPNVPKWGVCKLLILL